MRLFGATSIRRLLRRSAITIGYGSGLPHEGTGLSRLPVTGGIGGSSTPLETCPAPIISGVTLTGMPSRGRGAAGPDARPAASAPGVSDAIAAAADTMENQGLRNQMEA